MGNSMPKRSRARWREGAPPYICDVFDHPNFADRYTVAFTGAEFFSGPDAWVQYLTMSESPTHPQGVSMWGEMRPHEFTAYRYANGKRRIRWLDLPEHIRRHVIARAEAV